MVEVFLKQFSTASNLSFAFLTFVFAIVKLTIISLFWGFQVIALYCDRANYIYSENNNVLFLICQDAYTDII